MTDIKETIERLEASATAVIAAQKAVRDACGVGVLSDVAVGMRIVSGAASSEIEQRENARRDYLKDAGDPRTILALITAFKELEVERDRLKAGWKGAQAGWSELIEEHRALEAERDRLREALSVISRTKYGMPAYDRKSLMAHHKIARQALGPSR